MSTEMKNKIPTSITVENITTELLESSDSNNTLELSCGGISLCELPADTTEDNVNAIKQEICTVYNDYLVADKAFLTLMARYTNHLKKYNNGMWTSRADFNTEETYNAFICGIVTSIYGYINSFISSRIPNAVRSSFSLDDILNS